MSSNKQADHSELEASEVVGKVSLASRASMMPSDRVEDLVVRDKGIPSATFSKNSRKCSVAAVNNVAHQGEAHNNRLRAKT